MRIGFVSDNPRVASGYANQGDLMAQVLSKHCELFYIAMSDQGIPYDYHGYTIVANPNEHGDPFMNTWLPVIQQRYGLEAIITLKDPYVYEKQMVDRLVNWFPFVPVDTEPISFVNVHLIENAVRPLAIAPNGIKELAAHGLKPIYMPLAYNKDVFYPVPKEEARARLKWPADRFIALFIGANQSTPSRKGIETMLAGWRMFVEQYPDSTLFMHTRPVQGGGVHIPAHAAALGLSEAHVTSTDQIDYNLITPAEIVNLLYNAADVTVNIATGGGFELALLESQAVGTPVITSDYTAMRDLVWSGWKLNQGVAPANQRVLDVGLGAWRLQSLPTDLASALASAYHRRNSTALREAAIKGAQSFELERVATQYWLPALKMIEQAAKVNLERLTLAKQAALRRASFANDFAEQVTAAMEA